MTEPNETNAAFRAKSEANTKRESKAEKQSVVFFLLTSPDLFFA